MILSIRYRQIGAREPAGRSVPDVRLGGAHLVDCRMCDGTGTDKNRIAPPPSGEDCRFCSGWGRVPLAWV